MKLTAVSRAVKLYFRLLFYRPIRYQISLLSASNAATHWRNQLSPSKMYSHGTSRPKPPPLLTRFLFIITPFPQLVNQVSINLGTWPMTLNSLFKKGSSTVIQISVWTWSFLVSKATAFTSFSFLSSRTFYEYFSHSYCVSF